MSAERCQISPFNPANQRISRNPCDGVSLPRLPDHRQRFLTMAELQDLADRAGAYRLMILVLGLCGLRFGECAALRVARSILCGVGFAYRRRCRRSTGT